MRFSCNRAILCVLLAWLATAGASAHGADAYKPWSLRDHYSFDGEHSTFKFDVQTAEWLVEVSGFGLLVKDVQCEIEYADGHVLRLSQLKAIKDDREPFDGPLGEGTRFRSIFEVDNGLEVDYSVARFKTRPFLIIHMNLTNRGTEPIGIREIRPAVFDAGSVAELGDRVVVNGVQTRRRGNFSMMGDAKGAGLVTFAMKDPKMTLGVGVLRSGLVDSYVDLHPDGKSWTGAVRNVYTPQLMVLPNSRVGCDPVWMSLFIAEPKQVSETHAWSEITGTQPVGPEAVPQGWVTVAAGGSASALYEAASAWSGNNIKFALVPAGWQEKSGGLNGRAPDYPKDMGKVARELAQLGMVPGITFDPLAVDEADPNLSVKASDGTLWFDLGQPAARLLAASRVQRLIKDGFEFLVVQQSAIPNDVLQRFNVTRDQADLFAMQLATDAAEGRPVLPSTAASLGGELIAWQDAAETTSGLKTYGASAGPLRIDTEKIDEVSAPLSRAIGEYDGPVEVVGTPKRSVRAAVGSACCAPQAPEQKPAQGGSPD